MENGAFIDYVIDINGCEWLLFSIQFSVLPQLNTKMALAMLGIALVAYQGFQKHRITFSRDLLVLLSLLLFSHLSALLLLTIIIQMIILMSLTSCPFLRGWEVHMWFVMLFAHFTVRRH